MAGCVHLIVGHAQRCVRSFTLAGSVDRQVVTSALRLEHLIFAAPLVEPQTAVIGSGRGLMATVTNSNGTVLWHSALPCGCGVINSENEGFTSLLIWTPFLPCYLPCDSTGGVLLLLSQAHQYCEWATFRPVNQRIDNPLPASCLIFVFSYL